MNIGWNFPVSTGGEVAGFNNAAMDHFKGDRTASIVRETIQNSLDVREDKSKPIVVAFTIDLIPSRDFREIKELKEPLIRSRNKELLDRGESSATRFYDTALDLVAEPKVRVLGIHDFNTTGLTGPTMSSKDVPDEGWLALLKGAGQSIKKEADSGGSYGHGSKAPLAASRLRTVFYYSEILNGKSSEFRYQGKSILQTHFNKNDEQTQATGYFGSMDEKASPLLNEDVPAWPKKLRETVSSGCGTSIYIPFARVPEDDLEAWTEVKLAVLANFYYAILTGSLIVRLGNGYEFNSSNVAEQLKVLLLLIANGALKKIENELILAGLESAKTVLEPTELGEFNSKTFGKIRWFIRTGEQVDTKAVGLSRNGMLITRSPLRLRTNSFSGTKPFDLFISVEGAGSAVMKAIENPEHNKIEPERIDDEVERKDKEKQYFSFVEEVKELVTSLATQEAEEETSVSDLDDLFGGSKFDNARSLRGKVITELVVGKPKQSKQKEGADTEMPDPESIRSGRGVIGGDGKVETKGGEIPHEDGEKDIQGTKSSGKQVRDFRVIRQSAEKNIVSIFFTPIAKGDFQLFVFRSGETEKEPIPLRIIGEKEWSNSLRLKAVNVKARVALEVEVEPQDFNYALEGVTTDAN